MHSFLKPSLRGSVLILLVLFSALTAFGQLPVQATVGVPYTLDTTYGLFQILQQDEAEYASLGVTVSIVFTTTSALPPGLSYSPVGILSGTPTTPGTYTVAVQVQETITTPQITFGPYTFPFLTYTINVVGGSGPAVIASPSSLSFSLTTGTGASTQSISLSNRGAAATFQASASGGSFLAATGGGALPAFGQGSVVVTANPSALAPGTYTGTVSISGSFSGSPISVPVVVTVTASQPLMSLSQTGLFFRAASGGPAPPSQSFTVSNVGAGSLNFAASATTLSGGPWLSVSPTSGVSTASSSPQVNVQVNATGVAAGTYYGQVTVAANGVPNSPQLVSVVLNVAAAATNVDPDVRPTALIFVGKQGATTGPAAKPVVITDLGSGPATFSSSISYVSTATGWISVTPGNGMVAPGTPSSPMISVSPTKLTAGIYVGQVTLAFSEAKTLHNIAVVFLVLPAGSVASPEIGALQPDSRKAGGCAPTKLLPVFSSLGQSFTTSAAWPSEVEVTAVDDCGTPVTAGSVVVSFSTGDAPISLVSLKDGRWSGTWTPQNTPTTTVSLTATAQTYAPALTGTTMIGGTSNSNPGIPRVQSGGVVNAASNAPSTPVAPGGYISIYGSSLASGLTVATAPFPTTLGGTQVLMGGQPLPLYFTSDGQINALVPYNMATNTTWQVLVTHDNAYSTPQAVTVADGGPGIFLNSQGGGIVVGVKPDQTQYLVGPSSPTTAGDALVIYCAGLGAVNQNVAAGAVSPGSPLAATTNPVTVTIEGISAQVLYAGLAPGFAGLYQVNVIVPSGLTASNTAPLVITDAGQSSPPAPIAVH
jgi:uncharacterized protein (TIGR03437 family)